MGHDLPMAMKGRCMAGDLVVSLCARSSVSSQNKKGIVSSLQPPRPPNNTARLAGTFLACPEELGVDHRCVGDCPCRLERCLLFRDGNQTGACPEARVQPLLSEGAGLKQVVREYGSPLTFLLLSGRHQISNSTNCYWCMTCAGHCPGSRGLFFREQRAFFFETWSLQLGADVTQGTGSLWKAGAALQQRYRMPRGSRPRKPRCF